MSLQNFNNNIVGSNNKDENLLGIVGTVVSSYVSHNSIASGDLAMLIENIYRTFTSLGEKKKILGARPEPAVLVKNSVTDDYIVCLEDGRKLKMLKRHLKTTYNMTPDDYRERWNLPSEYPMVAPTYAEKRSKLAKAIRLGKSRRSGGRMPLNDQSAVA